MLRLQWSSGMFQGDTVQRTAEANAAAIAQIRVLDQLIDLTPEELNEALEDEQQI